MMIFYPGWYLTSIDLKTMTQGCCLAGTQSPEVPMICLRATKMLNKELARVPKTYDSYGNNLYAYFQWRNDSLLILHF